LARPSSKRTVTKKYPGDDAYVTTVFVGTYAPLGIAGGLAQTPDLWGLCDVPMGQGLVRGAAKCGNPHSRFRIQEAAA